MELMEAIYRRRAVRSYTERTVDRDTVMTLIRAAVQAPSALNDQPWAFAIIQDARLLAEYSDRAKALVLATLQPGSPLGHFRDTLANPGYNLFYDASTLIIICAKPAGANSVEDCCLAAQNLMLAAYGMSLGTCPIGFARPWLALPEVKRELGIPADYAPVFPVIVGYPKGETPPVPRNEPEILLWK
jgi:nitroreductase